MKSQEKRVVEWVVCRIREMQKWVQNCRWQKQASQACWTGRRRLSAVGVHKVPTSAYCTDGAPAALRPLQCQAANQPVPGLGRFASTAVPSLHHLRTGTGTSQSRCDPGTAHSDVQYLGPKVDVRSFFFCSIATASADDRVQTTECRRQSADGRCTRPDTWYEYEYRSGI